MITKNVPYCYPVQILDNGTFVRIDLFVLIPLEAGKQVVTSTVTNPNPAYSPDTGGINIIYYLEANSHAPATYFYDRIRGIDGLNLMGFLYIDIDSVMGGTRQGGNALSLTLWANHYDFDDYDGPDTDTIAYNCPYIRLNNDSFGLMFYPKVIIPNQGTDYHYVDSLNDETVVDSDTNHTRTNYACKVILQAGGTPPPTPEEPIHLNDDANLTNTLHDGGDFVVEVDLRDNSGNPTGKVKKGKVKNKASAGVINPGGNKGDHFGRGTIVRKSDVQSKKMR